MGFKYSVTLSSFRKKEPIKQTLARLKTQGFDAVEMFGEPDKINQRELRETIVSYDIPVCGVTGMWGGGSEDSWKRKLLSLDSNLVNYSKNYIKKCIEMCEFLGGGEINICLFADDVPMSFDANHNVYSENLKKAKIKKAIPILSSMTRFAADHNVTLLIEPLNRFSTPYCCTAEDAIYIAQKINQKNLGVLLDTFHMNIEESSFEQAILDSKDFLWHTHFAENNRAMPGYAHLDFESIVKTLQKIRYDKYVCFEPHLAADYKSVTLKGLKFIKKLEKFADS
ncbi:MAG TPA: sugar phosphate isomerase/epimerase family protein [Nitrosopumilaceae archaeon]|nr:sugar phosphate isomerase/epimerase family protein [Nitrosopumilaceae archaeon]